jgi:hypothetical protein
MAAICVFLIIIHVFLIILCLTPKRPKAIFRHFLKFGQAIVKAIFIKNS